MDNKFYINPKDGVHGNDVVTPVGRCAFLNLDKPNTTFDPPKYGLTLLFKKDDEAAKAQLKAMQAMCLEMADVFAKNLWNKTDKKIPFAKFKEATVAKMAAQPIFRDGDMAKYESHHGCWYIVAKNAKITEVTFLDGRIPQEFEPGMLVRCQVQPYVDQKGFAYKLRGIRLVKDDGERFRTAPSGGNLLAAIDDAVDAVSTEVGLGEAFDAAVTADTPVGSPLDVL